MITTHFLGLITVFLDYWLGEKVKLILNQWSRDGNKISQLKILYDIIMC